MRHEPFLARRWPPPPTALSVRSTMARRATLVLSPRSRHLVDDPHYNRWGYSTRTGPATSADGSLPADDCG